MRRLRQAVATNLDMARTTRKKIYFWTLLLVAVIGVIVAFFTMRAGVVEMPGLFEEVSESKAPETFVGQKFARRHRWVRLNPEGMERLLEVGNSFRLNLFPDLDLMCGVAKHRTEHHGDQAVMAYVENQPMDSLVVLSRSGDLMCGRVTLDDGRQFEINNVDGGALYVILEVNPAKVGKCGTCEPPQEAAAPAKPKKTSSNGDVGAFARQIAGALNGPNLLERCVACGNEKPAAGPIPPTRVAEVPAATPLPLITPPREVSWGEISRARLAPALAALRVPPSLLAGAGRKWQHHTSEGTQTRPNTLPPQTKERFETFDDDDLKYIDILFIYTAGITDTPAQIQTRVNALLLEANQYLQQSRIPIQLRQVTDGGTKVWKANARAMTAMGDIGQTDGTLLLNGYPPDGPAWQINAGDSGIVRPDYKDPLSDSHTKWPTFLLGIPAQSASYQPKFVDATKSSLIGYMQWLTNRSNSLLFGDQYWGAGQLYVGSEIDQIEVNATNQDFESRNGGSLQLGNGTSLPDGWPVRFIGEVPDISHTRPGLVGLPIKLDTILYYREKSAGGGGGGWGGGGADPTFRLYSTEADAITDDNRISIGSDHPIHVDSAVERPQRYMTLAVANERKEFYTDQPYLNVKASTLWHLEPSPTQWPKLYMETVNRAISIGPLDYDTTGLTENDFEINTDNVAIDDPFPDDIERYSLDASEGGTANGTIYGRVFNEDYTDNSDLGLRMDYNGTDYYGNSFDGTPMAVTPPRYPNLHRFDETPYGGSNPRTPRADLVILLTEDTPDYAGLSNMYLNWHPRKNVARTVGRGPTPPSNSVQTRTFENHAGDLMVTGKVEGIFSNLPISEIVTEPVDPNKPSGLLAWYPFEADLTDNATYIHNGTAYGNPTYVTGRNGNGSALRLDGSTYIAVNGPSHQPGDFNFNATTSWSATVWINADDIGVEGWLFGQRATSTGAAQWQNGLKNSRLATDADSLSLFDSGNEGTLRAGSGEWTHMGWIFDRTDATPIPGTGNVTLAGPMDYGIPTNGLVGFFPFNSNVQDRSGYNYDGWISTAVAPTSGLIAHYPFDGSSNDATGNGYDITTGSNYQWLNDAEKGSFAKLSGGHFMLPDFPVGGWSAITMSMWINEESISNSSAGEFYLNLGSGGSSVFFIESSGSPAAFNYPGISHGQSSDYRNKWTHHLVTIDGTGSKAYINGVLIGTKAQAGFYASKVAQFAAGRSAIGKHWWNGGSSTRYTGGVDDVRIYNRALNAAEVTQLYNAESPSGSGNGAVFAQDRFGNIRSSISMDGIDDQVTWGKTAADAWFSGRTQATLSMWIKPNAVETADKVYFDHGSRAFSARYHAGGGGLYSGNSGKVAAGEYHSLFIKDDATLWAMGRNQWGQLGDGTGTQRNTPVQVGKVGSSGGGANEMPILQAHPADRNTTEGNLVDMIVIAASASAITYQWQKDGANIPGATASSYQITNAQQSDNGTYRVMVGNAHGSVTSNAAVLGVGGTTPIAPVVLSQPANQVCVQGSSATFVVVADGTLPMTYQWQKDGVDIAGATFSSHTVSAASASDVASYRCVVTNAAGSVTSIGATLAVTTTGRAPFLITQPADQNVTVGTGFTLSIAANGTAPFTYQWQKDGSAIPGATASAYTVGSAAAGHNGTYRAVVSNSHGSVNSKTAILEVVTLTRAPFMVTNPANQVARPGDVVDLAVTANGTAPLTYKWQKDGVDIAGTNSRIHTIANMQAADAAAYRCVVTNAQSTVTSAAATVSLSSAKLVVPGRVPWLVSRPADQNAYTGGSVTFGVAANGTAPITYQWQKDGVNIAGATGATYNIVDVQIADVATYRAVISNTYGSITSPGGTLGTSDGAGKKKWEFVTGHLVYSSPAIASDGTIYFGSVDKKVYALNPDGTEKWNFATGGFVRSSPAIGTDGTVYFGSNDGNLYALNPDGTKRWEYVTGGGIWCTSPAIGADGTIYIGSDDNKVYALNPDGTKRWEITAGHWVRSSPAVGADGTVYVGSTDGKLYALEGKTGINKWEFKEGADDDAQRTILEGRGGRN